MVLSLNKWRLADLCGASGSLPRLPSQLAGPVPRFAVLLLIGLAALSRSTNAAAGIPIPVVYGTDERIVPVEPTATKDSLVFGYYYERFTIYYIPVWRYGGKYVLYFKNRYRDVGDSELKRYKTELGSFRPAMPFWDHYVDWIVSLIGIAVLVLAGIGLLSD